MSYDSMKQEPTYKSFTASGNSAVGFRVTSDRYLSAYKKLRRELSPLESCEVIAGDYGTSAQSVRRFVGLNREFRVCRDCWQEFRRKESHKYFAHHRCDECWIAHSREKYKPAQIAERHRLAMWRTKFMNDNELYDYARKMLGMSREEYEQSKESRRVQIGAKTRRRG